MRALAGGAPPCVAAALLATMWLLPPVPARARDDESIVINGEVEAYVEAGETNFAGDYNVGAKGDPSWGQFFGEGLDDSYGYRETWHRESELRFRKRTQLTDRWRMDNELEFEFKARNAGSNPNDFDVEEASATFVHDSGWFLSLGILEDLRLFREGWATTTAWMGASTSDEETSVRAGYRAGGLLADLRYHSIVREQDTSGFAVQQKRVNEQLYRLQLAYDRPERFSALLMYTVVDTENKEEADFQAAERDLPATDFREYAATGLTDYVNLGLGLRLEFEPVRVWLTHEDWRYELDDGGREFDVVIDSLGLSVSHLGPATLVLVYETGTGDPVGPEVTYWAWSAEYLWSPSPRYRIGDPQIGPGLKFYGNDAEEELEGQAYYVVMEWRF